MANAAAGLAYIAQLLSQLSGKKAQADAVAAQVKAKAKVIDGVPYLPTGFENLSIDDYIKELKILIENTCKLDNVPIPIFAPFPEPTLN